MGVPTSISNPSYSKTVYLDVRSYVPIGEVLTQNNFNDALEAAYADAIVKSDAITNGPGIPQPSAQMGAFPRYQVLVPRGLWKLSRTLSIPSRPQTNPQPMTPGISGEEMRSTGFFVDTNDFTATNGTVFDVGGDNGDNYTFYPLFENFHVQTHGAVSNNVNCFTFKVTFAPLMRNVTIFGFQDVAGRPHRGWGIRIIDNDSSANNQYPQLTNVYIQGCSGGIYAENCLPLKLNDVYCKQNLFFDAVFEGTVVAWDGGSVESGIAPSGSAYKLSKGLPRVMTGWKVETSSGTGASVGVASGDLTTVTGLTGIDGDNDLYRWLYLEKASGAYDGVEIVSGYYLIVKILSATSVVIRKGSSHSATGSLNWSIREARGVTLDMYGMVYHESECLAGIGMYAQTGGTGAVNIRGCNMANCDFAVESLSSPGRNASPVKIDGTAQMSKYVKIRNCPQIICLDADETNIGDVDDWSRESLVMRSLCQSGSGVSAFVTSVQRGPVWSARMEAGRARTMCRLAGATAIWDARVASSFVKSGADITSWTDLINGFVATLVNATKYPQYAASDAKFNNQPSVTFTGGTAANTCALTASIAAGYFNAYESIPCMIVVAATPAAAELAPNTSCRVQLLSTAGGGSGLTVQMLEQFDGNPHYFGGMFTGGGGFGGDTQPMTQVPDTNAHVFVHGGGMRSGPRISSETHTRTMSNFINSKPAHLIGWAQASASFRMQSIDSPDTGTFSSPFMALFPHGLSRDMRDQIMDALATEFGVANR